MTLSMGPIGHRAANVVAIAVLVIWLYGALVLAERRSDHAIMLLGSVAGMVLFTVQVSRPGGLAGRTSWTVWRRRPLTYQTSAILSGQVADPLRSDDSAVCTLHVSLRLASTYRP